MPTQVEVQPGDCIASIAYAYGFFPETLWQHPANAGLKALRKDPNVLLPGDKVILPEKGLKQIEKSANAHHRFRRKGIPKRLRIQLLSLEKPIADMHLQIDVDGKQSDGVTDTEGWLDHPISPNARLATITLEDGTQYFLELGFQDPIDEISGIQTRLFSLGFYDDEIDGTLSDATQDALRRFQSSQGWEPTGQVDAQSKARLLQLTGE